MSGGPPPWTAQSGFDIRLCWGPNGARAVGAGVGAVVIVDVLRFTTALNVAVSVGARVIPSTWPGLPGPADPVPEETVVADGRGPRGLSLSPATLTTLRAGERVLLPSANGSHCSALAAELGVPVVGGALRNAGAVARWLLEETARSPVAPIAVVPCGERWPDGSLRPAVEDLIGAGAIVAALCAGDSDRTVSPEASAARAAFVSALTDLYGALAGAASGCELHLKGMGDDIRWAAELDVSSWVPVLGADGAYIGVSRPG